MKDKYGMHMNKACAYLGHRWGDWAPVGHIEGAEWRHCRRGCATGQMRYPEREMVESEHEMAPRDA